MTEQAQQQTLSDLRRAVERIESAPAAAVEAQDRPAETARSDVDAARQLVLRKLTGSAKSRHQLAEALREKEFEEPVIAEVLDRMQDVGLVDDASFAQTWVRTRHETKGLGARALRRELQDRGVPEADVEAALDQLTSEDEDSAARELLDRRLGETTIPAGNGAEERREREKHMRRLVAMLGRRGHSPAAAMRLVREALDERTG
ncbi:MAG: regulatory protein RecX [Nesterenkonia sp.]|nr:regulatory protein RecX [Nesterenkonia sp.]